MKNASLLIYKMMMFLPRGGLFVAFVAFASVSWGQAVGGSGKGGGGLVSPTAVRDGRGGCVEGRPGSITVVSDNGYPQDVYRVCRNGSFMNEQERAAYVYNPDIRCRNGDLATWTVHDGSLSDHMIYQPMICRGGKWVPRRD